MIQQLPCARQDGLIVQTLPDEVLVYDQERDKALCLNLTAARVWKHCDGKTSVTKIARLLKMDDEVVWIALNKLGRSHLLDGRITRPPNQMGISRREIVRAAMIALPVVITISVPMPAQAATCGITCSTDANCLATPGCPPRCVAGVCVN